MRGLEWSGLAQTCAPGIVDWRERRVLAEHEARRHRSESRICKKPFGGFLRGDGARAAAHGLDVVVGQFADGFHSAEHRRG